MHHAKENQKTVAIIIADKINFKLKTVTRDKEDCYIMIKGSIHHSTSGHQNLFSNTDICERGNRQYNKSSELQYCIFRNRSLKQKINREMLNLNNSLEQIDLTDIYRTFHPIVDYTFFSQAHKTFPGCTKQVLANKRRQIIPNILFNHNRMKLAINKEESW